MSPAAPEPPPGAVAAAPSPPASRRRVPPVPPSCFVLIVVGALCVKKSTCDAIYIFERRLKVHQSVQKSRDLGETSYGRVV